MIKRPLHLFAVLVLLLFANSCAKDATSFRRLSEEELIQRVLTKQMLPPDILIVDRTGKKVDDALLKRLNNGEMATDLMVDKFGKPVRKVVREKTLDDEILNCRLAQAYRGWTEIPKIEIDCNQKKNILEGIFRNMNLEKNEQETGEELWNKFPPGELVINLIEQCGLPTKREVGEDAILTLFYTLNYNEIDIPARFYPEIKLMVERGDLSEKELATTQDRLLAHHGKKQIYGTSVRPYRTEEGFYIPSVIEPEKLDERRAEIGLVPMQVYIDEVEKSCKCKLGIPEELQTILNEAPPSNQHSVTSN